MLGKKRRRTPGICSVSKPPTPVARKLGSKGMALLVRILGLTSTRVALATEAGHALLVRILGLTSTLANLATGR
ncbi:MAG: hypothetical protein HBSAPP02_09300 [Phycisphaerae bacterium]|nr:MAG: hypothetical protein HBSAPP02_09300 [Phycisphaerae bacterium]